MPLRRLDETLRGRRAVAAREREERRAKLRRARRRACARRSPAPAPCRRSGPASRAAACAPRRAGPRTARSVRPRRDESASAPAERSASRARARSPARTHALASRRAMRACWPGGRYRSYFATSASAWPPRPSAASACTCSGQILARHARRLGRQLADRREREDVGGRTRAQRRAGRLAARAPACAARARRAERVAREPDRSSVIARSPKSSHADADAVSGGSPRSASHASCGWPHAISRSASARRGPRSGGFIERMRRIAARTPAARARARTPPPTRDEDRWPARGAMRSRWAPIPPSPRAAAPSRTAGRASSRACDLACSMTLSADAGRPSWISTRAYSPYGAGLRGIVAHPSLERGAKRVVASQDLEACAAARRDTAARAGTSRERSRAARAASRSCRARRTRARAPAATIGVGCARIASR